MNDHKPNWDAAFGSIGGTAVGVYLAAFSATKNQWVALALTAVAAIGATLAFTRKPVEEKP